MLQSLELHDVWMDTLPEMAANFSQVWRQKLVLKRGERVLVSAPSGKGKSSFIAMLYGLRRDFSGFYRLDGDDTRLFSASQWSDVRTNNFSIVFQDLRLFGDYTGWENLGIKSNLTNPKFDKEGALIMAEQLRVDALLGKKCGQLSYGERQRVAIIRALLQPVDFLIMDEPFSHLDEENTARAIQLIENERFKNQSGIIITTLGPTYGWSYDRIVML